MAVCLLLIFEIRVDAVGERADCSEGKGNWKCETTITYLRRAGFVNTCPRAGAFKLFTPLSRRRSVAGTFDLLGSSQAQHHSACAAGSLRASVPQCVPASRFWLTPSTSWGSRALPTLAAATRGKVDAMDAKFCGTRAQTATQIAARAIGSCSGTRRVASCRRGNDVRNQHSEYNATLILICTLSHYCTGCSRRALSTVTGSIPDG